ncbi:unnamed protein product [Adineta ricciae]|uniref:Uncharacterized protein n=1 Tax=Adineta ricciae TaxID=249248 RepID=A0A814X1P3_ADIRI|nr:unnamed protein product [Adineta ricciae]CAF1209006.1 unnamed protein product [Adineta ricciae]
MTNNKKYSCIIFIIIVLLTIYFTSDIIFSKTLLKFIIDTTSNQSIQHSEDYIKNHVQEPSDELNAHWLRLIKHYVPLPLESGYGSHKLALLAALLLTAKDGGPVVEMGCGYHSTLLLHQLAVDRQKRYVLSTDTDREWLLKFQNNMSSSLHQFRFINRVSEWNSVGNDRPRWSIAFIDHKPGERRVVDIIRLINMTDLIIVHDSETASYQYERGLQYYPYRYHYTYLSTATDVASRTKATLLSNIKYLLELTINLKVPKQ